jgi:predicted Zn-ribbon and HTH transcriptional regulator
VAAMLIESEKTRIYKTNCSNLFDAVLKVIKDLNMTVEHKNETNGSISACSGFEWRGFRKISINRPELYSPGSKLTVTIKEENGEVAVNIKADPKHKLKLELIDAKMNYRRGSDEIDNIFDKLDELLNIKPIDRPTDEAVKMAEKNKRICPSCKSSVAESARFCTSCGANLEKISKEGRICPSCKSSVAESAKFCINCGAKL